MLTSTSLEREDITGCERKGKAYKVGPQTKRHPLTEIYLHTQTCTRVQNRIMQCHVSLGACLFPTMENEPRTGYVDKVAIYVLRIM